MLARWTIATTRSGRKPQGRAGLLLLVAAVMVACGDGSPDAPRDEDATMAAPTRGGILVAKGCNQCHSVERLDIEADAQVGPDLSDAAVNVVSRYGRDLHGFFDQPSGTMQLVLTQHIQLTEEETDSIVSLLTRIARE